MTEFKRIDEKKIWVLLKVYHGGKIEFSEAYWKELDARTAAAKQIPLANDSFSLSLHTVNLYGGAIDKKL